MLVLNQTVSIKMMPMDWISSSDGLDNYSDTQDVKVYHHDGPWNDNLDQTHGGSWVGAEDDAHVEIWHDFWVVIWCDSVIDALNDVLGLYLRGDDTISKCQSNVLMLVWHLLQCPNWLDSWDEAVIDTRDNI